MVHLAIENLLSSCTNRPLYEALWFLAFTKNSRSENFENESVTAICNELIARIRNEDIDARSFLISTNLAFGTVRLYKAQIDKLYDQAKCALQSCRSTFNHMDWFTQMTQVTSTPIVQPRTPRTQKIMIQTQTTIRKKSAKKSVTQPATPKILDDFDLIESIYAIAEENEDIEMTSVPKGRKRGSNNYDTGIGMDPTMVSDVHAITMREPTSFMSSGFQTMLTNDDEDEFGDKMGDEFQNFLKETESTILSQDDLIQTTSNLLSTVNSRKRTKIIEESIEIKKRRLTYMNNDDESISILRNANIDLQVPNIDIYQQEVPFEMNEASTFYESLNVTEATARNSRRSMPEKTLQFEPMDIEEPSIPMTTFNDPTIPNTTFNDQSTLQNNSDTLLENLTLNEPTIPDNDATMIPDIPMKEAEILPQESELLLDDIPKFIKQKRVRKSRSLVTDKQIMLPIESVKKGIQNYEEKLTGIPPFADFRRRMHYFKSCTDVLFSTGSFRLKKSTLHELYVRNMKKVPEKLLKQQVKETGTKSKDIKELRRSSRSAKPIINLKEQEMFDIEEEPEENVKNPQKDVEMKEISSLAKNSLPELDDILADIENISPDIARKSKRSTRSSKAKMILKESKHNIDVEMEELKLPELEPFSGTDKVQPMDDMELPPALDYENIKFNNVNMRDLQAEDNERIDRKKEILKKLAKFWKQSDKLITMDKICNGMLRSEAAGTFFELLLLAKRCVVELVHKTDSLEISNILCKISNSQLSKELYN